MILKELKTSDTTIYLHYQKNVWFYVVERLSIKTRQCLKVLDICHNGRRNFGN
jgi:hypothetical protein